MSKLVDRFGIILFLPNSANKKYELVSKTQLKKIKNFLEAEAKKDAKKADKESEDAQRREKNLEEAKKIVISEDKTLPKAKEVKIKLTNASEDRVKVLGWVHRLRRQGWELPQVASV